jgi:hypothetical protein
LKTQTMRGIAEAMFAPTGAGAEARRGGSVEDFIKLNGGLPVEVPAEVKEIGESEGHRRVTFVSEPGLVLPAVVWPAKGEARAIVVLVSDIGKGQAAEAFPVARLQKAGIMCIALDPRGLGETKGLDLRLQTYLGQAPAFGMGWDIVRAISALGPSGPKVAVVGRGPAAGLAALTAGLIKTGIGFVAGIGTLKEFADAFRDDVPLIAVQPRANYAPSLPRLRSLVKAETVWSFLGEKDPDWTTALVRWAAK